MAKYLRCYMCSDLHAANRTYRKLLNAIKWELSDAGHDESLIDEIIGLLTPLLTKG